MYSCESSNVMLYESFFYIAKKMFCKYLFSIHDLLVCQIHLPVHNDVILQKGIFNVSSNVWCVFMSFVHVHYILPMVCVIRFTFILPKVFYHIFSACTHGLCNTDHFHLLTKVFVIRITFILPKVCVTRITFIFYKVNLVFKCHQNYLLCILFFSISFVVMCSSF